MDSIKSRILKSLPKGFKCSVSRTGLIVQIWVDINKVCSWDRANKLVYGLAKKLKLKEFGASTNLDTMVTMICDWEFINPIVEKNMLSEAKSTLKAMKSFFKKYGNSYCSSSKCYDIIEEMRNLVATDEN